VFLALFFTAPCDSADAATDQIAFTSGGDLWMANGDGTNRRQIVTRRVDPYYGDREPREPSLAPDGASVAYISQCAAFTCSNETYPLLVGIGNGSVRDMDGGQVLEWKDRDLYHDAAFSPDGSEIAYGLKRTY
jgi:Tol biopolymer transport system component